MRAGTRITRPCVTAVVLAAGGSSRLGVPKQLVRLRVRPLLVRAVSAARAATGRRVIVVIGADALRLRALLARSFSAAAVDVVQHAGWRSGLAGSLRRGVHAVPADAHAVLFALSDQPLVDARSLARLVAAWRRRPAHAAAARYFGRLGVPAILPRSTLRALGTLTGDEGARRLLAAASNVTAVEMPEAAFDIDTREDLDRLAEARYRPARAPRARLRVG